MTVRAIIAADPTGIIGVNNTLPWRYKADMARFKALTTGGCVLMGRKTFDSIPIPKSGHMLPDRYIVVITRDTKAASEHRAGNRPEAETRPDFVATTIAEGVRVARDLAYQCCDGKTWIIGGAEVYVQAVKAGLVDEIDYTVVPAVTVPEGADVTRLPEDFLSGFALVGETPNEAEPQLTHRTYRRCSSQPSS